MGKYILIYDQNINFEDLENCLQSRKNYDLELFSLTSDFNTNRKIEEILEGISANKVTFINTAKLIDIEAACFRDELGAWSDAIRKKVFLGKRIDEWLVLKKLKISAWWFTLLAERNPFKTDGYLKLAQAASIKKILLSGQYNGIMVSLQSRDLCLSIKNFATTFETSYIKIKSLPAQNIKFRILNSGIIGDFIIFLYFLGSVLVRKLLIYRKISRRSDKRDKAKESLFFVTYFPYLEKDEAEKGFFKNKYALDLQELLQKKNIAVTWLAISVNIDGFQYKDSVRFANIFSAKGVNVFLLEEFISLTDVIRAVYYYFKALLISRFLYFKIKIPAGGGYIPEEASPIISRMWEHSFFGPVVFNGFLYSLAFRRIFSSIKNIQNLLYFSEMLIWEQAMNALRFESKTLKNTVGFMHTSIPKNMYHFFWSREETRRSGKIIDLPLPDIMAANGNLMREALKKCAYPDLIRLESIRHLYIEKILSRKALKKKKKLVVAGSFDAKESMLLLELVFRAFPKTDRFQIIFKGHPSMPFEPLFSNMGIDFKHCGYITSNLAIRDVLEDAGAVLVPSSTVAIEALAFGCEILVPFAPDIISNNPLVGYESWYRPIYNPDDLVEAMGQILRGKKLHNLKESRDFVYDYWDLDLSMKRWSVLIKKRFQKKFISKMEEYP